MSLNFKTNFEFQISLTFPTTFSSTLSPEHFFKEKRSSYLSKMHQLTEKKNIFSISVLSVSTMVEISNLWVRFCFSAIGALLYKKILKIQLLGWMSSKFENIFRINKKSLFATLGGFETPGAFFLGYT